MSTCPAPICREPEIELVELVVTAENRRLSIAHEQVRQEASQLPKELRVSERTIRICRLAQRAYLFTYTPFRKLAQAGWR